MQKKSTGCIVVWILTFTAVLQTASARLYDNFNTSANWTLSNNGGTAVIASSELTLTSPANTISTPAATLTSDQSLTDSRQSILVRAHTGAANSTVFFLWAIDSAGNKLELKLDDVNPTTVVAGYYNNGGTYHYVGSAAYNPGSDGLYMAFAETNGVTYWEISTDTLTWTIVATTS